MALELLMLASLGLLIGPMISALGARVAPAGALLDGFAFALVGVLVVAFLVPDVVGRLGVFGLLLTAGGATVPWILHRLAAGYRSVGVLFVALAHAAVDGAVLAVGSDEPALAAAVVAHRLPVGVAVVVAARAARNPTRTMWAVAGAMVAATAAGFVGAPGLMAVLPDAVPAMLEAVVAGVLLHIVLLPHGRRGPAPEVPGHGHGHGTSGDGHGDSGPVHGTSDHGHGISRRVEGHGTHGHGARLAPAVASCCRSDDHGDSAPHDHAEPGTGPLTSPTFWAATGATLGIAAAVVGPMMLSGVGHDHSDAFFRTLGVLVLESAPALLAGYALAGIVPTMLAGTATRALGRGGPLSRALRGVVFGLPLPICSCGVLPLYASLVRGGAPPTAALAFFVATPELGLDAVLLSLPLLGTSLTAARVAAAFVVAVLVALIVGRFVKPLPSKAAVPVENQAPEPVGARIRRGLRFGFVEVFDHTMPWVGLGLVIAAMVEPMLAHGFASGVPRGLQVPVAALIGVPVYVCASGATPIVALAMHKGLSAGAAIAFLIAGPATNLTTFGVFARLHGARAALGFGLAVSALAIAAGWMVDTIGLSSAPALERHLDEGLQGSWFAWVCAAALASLSLASLYRQGPRGAMRQILEPIHTH